MRQIKFRGLRIDKSEMVFGDLIHGVGSKAGRVFILPDKMNLAYVKDCHPLDGVEVIPESVGQFTGLHDKNGKEIYEGDVSICFNIGKHIVEYYNGSFGYWLHKGEPFQYFVAYAENSNFKWVNGKSAEIEIIGNLHQNPELLTF